MSSSNLGRRKGREEEDDANPRPNKSVKKEEEKAVVASPLPPPLTYDPTAPDNKAILDAIEASLLPVVHGVTAKIVASYLYRPTALCFRPEMTDDEIKAYLHDPMHFPEMFAPYHRAQDRLNTGAQMSLTNAVSWIAAQHQQIKRRAKDELSSVMFFLHFRCVVCLQPPGVLNAPPPGESERSSWSAVFNPSWSQPNMANLHWLCKFHTPDPKRPRVRGTAIVTHAECVGW
jgi:hypothetical protein